MPKCTRCMSVGWVTQHHSPISQQSGHTPRITNLKRLQINDFIPQRGNHLEQMASVLYIRSCHRWGERQGGLKKSAVTEGVILSLICRNNSFRESKWSKDQKSQLVKPSRHFSQSYSNNKQDKGSKERSKLIFPELHIRHSTDFISLIVILFLAFWEFSLAFCDFSSCSALCLKALYK